MKIAVIILHYGKLETTKNCLKELKGKISDNQVILVNNTQDDCKGLTLVIPGTKLINNPTNLGFATGVNQGLTLALKDKSITHFFLMNNDLAITFGSFAQLLLTFTRFPHAGIVSPVLHHSVVPACSGRYDWGGKYNKWTGMVKHKNWDNKPKTVQTVSHVAGAAMLISRPVLEKIGLFDERFFLYYEDLDFCLRATKANFTIHINPDVIAEHEISAGSNLSLRTKYQWFSHFKFVNKHLFKLAYPTAYLYDLIAYPLWLIGSLLKRNPRLQVEEGSAAADRRLPNGK
jgi:GT2 family glycosyltransferase